MRTSPTEPMPPERPAAGDVPTNGRWAAYVLRGMRGLILLGSAAMLILDPRSWAQSLAGIGPGIMAIVWSEQALHPNGEDWAGGQAPALQCSERHAEPTQAAAPTERPADSEQHVDVGSR